MWLCDECGYSFIDCVGYAWAKGAPRCLCDPQRLMRKGKPGEDRPVWQALEEPAQELDQGDERQLELPGGPEG